MDENFELFPEEFNSDDNFQNLEVSENIIENEEIQSELSEEAKRLKEVISHEGMNITQFAQAIGVKISTMSHIIKGRNNPSLDIMQRTLRRFAYLNADWLILGKGESPFESRIMPLEVTNQMSGNVNADNENIELDVIDTDMHTGDDKIESVKNAEQHLASQSSNPDIQVDTIVDRVVAALQKQIPATSSATLSEPIPVVSAKSDVRVSKVIVFYSDSTFEQFTK